MKKVNENVHDLIINTKNFLDLDVFSLDIDGIDYCTIGKLPEDFSKIVILEYNHIFEMTKGNSTKYREF